ncbi:MAG: DUF2071 domain-containing protein [Candidatus Methanoperedens sp.]|nr:DUF2071 domain-containing protein [Candidatus Methanoperedens sp.]
MNYGLMLWYDTFFIHWRVPGAQLEMRIPAGLSLDLFNGDAYISLVALRAIGPSPGLLLPLSSIFLSYNQLNVRTYVKTGAERGIILLDTKVDHILPAVGARIFGMPYHFACGLGYNVRGNHVALNTPDIKGDIDTADPFTPPEGSLESFLTDRFWVFVRAPVGPVYGVKIKHAPWRLRPVKLYNMLSSSITGFGGASEPVCSYIAEKADVSMVKVSMVRNP